jgi:hypothetical protein
MNDRASSAPYGAQQPNFSGRWLNTSLEGSVDKFFETAGFSWLERKALSAAGFGRGKLQHSIAQGGELPDDELQLEINLPNALTLTLRLDGVPQKWSEACTRGSDKDQAKEHVISSYWDGEFLVTAIDDTKSKDKHRAFDLRRSLRVDDVMVRTFIILLACTCTCNMITSARQVVELTVPNAAARRAGDNRPSISIKRLFTRQA